MTEIILKVSALIGALAVITGFAVKLYKPVKTFFEDIKVIKKHSTENYMSVLRLTIMSEEMPLEERIKAGDEYISLGGNGAVKHKYEQLLEELE